MTDVVTNKLGESESVYRASEDNDLSPNRDEEIISPVTPKTAQTVISDPDAAAGPPLPSPPPLPLPPPPPASATLPTSPATPKAVVSASKKSRPPYKYDPDKITLRFLFANKDGLTVTVECNPADTVGEVKGALLSVWPEGLPDCSGGDSLRLICMGKGVLMPDTRTLEDCQVPVFKTHPTPVNVSIRPDTQSPASNHHKGSAGGSGNERRGGGGRQSHNNTASAGGNASSQPSNTTSQEADQGCACIIL